MENKSWSEKIVPILVVFAILQAFFIGLFWERIKKFEGADTTKVAGTNTGGQVANAQPQAQPQDTTGKLTGEQAKNVPPVTASDHIRGDKNAKVTWIEYSDFECPFCKTIHPNLEKMLTEYQGKVRWVYRQFPLESIHTKAMPAAIASECVAKLGGNDAFWSFADKAFEGAPASLTDLTKLATDSGVNKEDYESCIKDPAVETLVRTQLAGGEKAGVTGTPGSFIVDSKGNTLLVPGAIPYEQIKQVVDQALK